MAAPEGPPELVYKYMSSETALIVLDKLSLRWSSPLLFNDPFDGQWDPGWVMDTPKFREHLAAAIRELILGQARPRDYSDPYTRNTVRELRARYAAMGPQEREPAIAKEIVETFAQLAEP